MCVCVSMWASLSGVAVLINEPPIIKYYFYMLHVQMNCMSLIFRVSQLK